MERSRRRAAAAASIRAWEEEGIGKVNESKRRGRRGEREEDAAEG